MRKSVKWFFLTVICFALCLSAVSCRAADHGELSETKIGRASCRERVSVRV